MLRQLVLALPAMMFLVGCEAESGPLPNSKSLTPEKVASIATTIAKKYPDLPSELRGKVLNTVLQSIENMVFVEGGQFDMGDFGWICEYDEKDVCTWPCGQDPEQLCNISMDGNDDFVHPVKLSSYYLSKFQTILGDFDLFFTVQNKPLFDTKFRDRADLKSMYAPNLPAPTKSWQEAKDYCQWIGLLSGYPVDLPTEAQWEYAARSRGQHVLFPTDTGSLSFGKNFPVEGEGETFAVGRFTPNPLGIYNMSGNATDWVNDWYSKDYYQHSPLENPQGPKTGTDKVKRGSYYPEGPLLAASIVRRWPDKPIQDAYYPGTSFRCAIQSDKNL
ncbi:SUMF1/EgtB/PvdO family nonheme iron enzyme [Pseudomonas sp. F01002]|uniref:formylglycine-generating enzyme family protein n=1 Tax=Pseudomonas sp. F01002 TaxID=2555724 RepID=UPI002114501F|nr:SUMF1/EgtB/PvdO family nonheme iron enzyme [Pseudomonas sp. F01002]